MGGMSTHAKLYLSPVLLPCNIRPPSLSLSPQALIEFSMKRMCGVLLSRLQASARRVLKDPVGNVHARRMREDVTFYR